MDGSAPDVIPPAGYNLVAMEVAGVKVLQLVKIKSKKRKGFVKPMPDYNIPFERMHAIARDWQIGERYRVFFIISYLVGSRVSETLELRRGDFEMVSRDGLNWLDVRVITEKTNDANKKVRTVPIYMDGYESTFVEYVLKYLAAFGTGEKIFPFTRFMAHKMMKKIDFGAMVTTYGNKRNYVKAWFGHPHYLRHVRATHLKRYYKYTDEGLMEYFGWTSPAMPARYAPEKHAELLRYYKSYKEALDGKGTN
jgi:integrase